MVLIFEIVRYTITQFLKAFVFNPLEVIANYLIINQGDIIAKPSRPICIDMPLNAAIIVARD